MTISGIPFDGPIGAARVGYVDGQYAVSYTHLDVYKRQAFFPTTAVCNSG